MREPLPPGVIFSPMQCISCNGIVGGWNTVNWVTKQQCDSTGGTSSVGEGAPESTVGPCGQVLVAPNCNAYYANRSFGGIPIRVIKPMITLIGAGGGTVRVNACNISDSDPPGAIPVHYDSMKDLQDSCTAFSALHPELTLCLNRVHQYAPITVENTNINETFPTTTDTSSPWTYGIPLTVISGGVATAVYRYFTTPGAPPPGPPPTFNPIGQVPSAAIGALKALKAIFGAATGVIFGPILVRPDPVGGGQVASYGIILYNSDGTSSNTLITEIPLSS
jgi:hypothetical protein